MNFGDIIWCIISEEVVFETFTIWSDVNENGKKLAEFKI